MNEEPKSFWWKIWGRPVRFFAWIMLLSLVGVLGSIIILNRLHPGPRWSDIPFLSIIWDFCALFILALLGLITFRDSVDAHP